MIFPILDIAVSTSGQTRVTLATLGRDLRLGLRESDWVEVLDGDAVLQNRVAPLLKVLTVDHDAMVATLDGTTTVINSGKNKILRRWDQAGDAKFGGALPIVESRYGCRYQRDMD